MDIFSRSVILAFIFYFLNEIQEAEQKWEAPLIDEANLSTLLDDAGKLNSSLYKPCIKTTAVNLSTSAVVAKAFRIIIKRFNGFYKATDIKYGLLLQSSARNFLLHPFLFLFKLNECIIN